MRKTLVMLLLVTFAFGCDRTETPSESSRSDGYVRAETSNADDSSPVSDSGTDAVVAAVPEDAGDEPSFDSGSKIRGLSGSVINLAGGKRGTVLVFRAGEKRPVWSGRVDREGRFDLPDLEPGAYRVIVPADGVHGTADAYAFVTEGAGAKMAIHRPAGCKIRMIFRNEIGEPLSGARVDLTLPDLDHVAEPLTLEPTTDDRGRVVVRGSCVIGKIRGVLRPPGRAPFDWEQRTVGNGNDRFAIQLPAPSDAGLAPGAAAR